MKKILLGSVALVALGTASAFAADLPARTYTKAPAYVPAPIYNWTGFYIGGHIGGAFNGSDNLYGSDGRFAGGVQGGADYQFAPNWVLGIEAEYTWAARDTTNVLFAAPPAAVPFTVQGRSSDFGSVTGRLGYTWGPALLYAKGGLAFRGNNDNVNVFNTATGAPLAFAVSRKDTGYTVGAGLEYMFLPSWSAKVEYMYADYGRQTYFNAVDFSASTHTVKAGVNYHFNWGGPVVAGY